MTSLSGANLNNGEAVGPQGESMDSPSTFPAYPAYKNSGVEWLGEVPEHWTVIALKWLSPVFRGASPRPIDDPAYFDDDGEFGWVRISDVTASPDGYLYETTQKLSALGSSLSVKLEPGELFLSIAGSVGKPCITAVKACIHDGFVYFPWLSIDQRLLYRVFESSLCFGGLGKMGTQLNLNTDTVGGICIAVPPPAELSKALEFLDHETARIDALIEEQQRLIVLLKEKHQAVISHAVTKGLDSTVPMKDSGVEWLGKLPVHWKVSKLGHYAQLLTGFPFPSALFSDDESDVRLLRGANIGVGSLKWIDTVYWRLSESDSFSSYLMEEGQIVLGMDRPWISEGMRIARVSKDDMPCLLLQRVAAITPNAELDDEYLYYLLASELFKAYVEPDLTGVSVPHISPEQILSFQISVPEIVEQRRISSFIGKQLDQMSALFEHTTKSIELLQERRSALISATVTGKIDVRDWQPPAIASTPELAQEAV